MLRLGLVGIGDAGRHHARALASLQALLKVSERGIVFGPDGLEGIFAFSLHAEAARRFFAERGITGEHGYVLA